MSKVSKVIFKPQILPKKHSFYFFFNQNGSPNGRHSSKAFHLGGHLLFSLTKMTNNLITMIFCIVKTNNLDFNGRSETLFLMICVNAFSVQFSRYHNTVIFRGIKKNTLERNAFYKIFFWI